MTVQASGKPDKPVNIPKPPPGVLRISEVRGRYVVRPHLLWSLINRWLFAPIGGIIIGAVLINVWENSRGWVSIIGGIAFYGTATAIIRMRRLDIDLKKGEITYRAFFAGGGTEFQLYKLASFFSGGGSVEIDAPGGNSKPGRAVGTLANFIILSERKDPITVFAKRLVAANLNFKPEGRDSVAISFGPVADPMALLNWLKGCHKALEKLEGAKKAEKESSTRRIDFAAALREVANELGFKPQPTSQDETNE